MLASKQNPSVAEPAKSKDFTMQCRICHQPLQASTSTKKLTRARPRRCPSCTNAAALRRRHNDPVHLLAHRWRTNATKHWPQANTSLWSTATVRRVWKRWQGKSVMSDESDYRLLCLAPYDRHDPEHPPSPDRLVLMTTREAQRLARMSNRTEHFPHRVQQSMAE